MAELPNPSDVDKSSTVIRALDSAGISKFLQVECEVQPAGEVKLDGAATSNTCEQCLICGKAFPFKSTLRYHLRKSHRIVTNGLDDINYFQQKKCDICQAQFILKEELVQHLKLAHATTSKHDFKCDICHIKFTFKHDLRYHLVKIHFPETEKQYKNNIENSINCLKCKPKINFKSQQTFLFHYNKKHGTNKCHNCGLCFIKKNTLLKHIYQCFKKFGHIEFTYNFLNQFPVPVCPFCKSEVQLLTAHMAKCEHKPLKSLDHMDIKSPEECPVCNTVINLQTQKIKSHILECNVKLGTKKGYKVIRLSQISFQSYEIVNNDAKKQCLQKDCSKISVNLPQNKRSKNIAYIISKHICNSCNRTMETTQLEFLCHLERCNAMKTLIDVTYKCKLCSKYIMMNGKASLEKHIKTCQFSKRLKTFLCSTCKFVFASKGDFKGHIEFCSKILPTESSSVVVEVSYQSKDKHAAEFCESMRLIHKTKFAKISKVGAPSVTPQNQFETIFIKTEVLDDEYHCEQTNAQ